MSLIDDETIINSLMVHIIYFVLPNFELPLILLLVKVVVLFIISHDIGVMCRTYWHNC